MLQGVHDCQTLQASLGTICRFEERDLTMASASSIRESGPPLLGSHLPESVGHLGCFCAVQIPSSLGLPLEVLTVDLMELENLHFE